MGFTVTTALYCPNSCTETLLGLALSLSCCLLSGASESLSNWSRLSLSLKACFLCSKDFQVCSLPVICKPLQLSEEVNIPQRAPAALLAFLSFLSACIDELNYTFQTWAVQIASCLQNT